MTFKEIEKKIAELIKKETGASVEITITGEWIMVCTEDCEKLPMIKALMAKTKHILCSEEYYEADDDLPAAVTLQFK